MPRVRVLLAEDHGFTLAGMQRLVGEIPDFEVVGAANGGIEAIALARKLRPDLAVLDFAMPDATGLEVFLELRRWSPETRTAIVTGTHRQETLSQLATAGVHGLFSKGADPSDICTGLARVAAGERILPQTISVATHAVAEGATTLSAREIEVLQAIARGLTNAGIGDELSISPKTVESHRASLMRKLGVNSTAALVVRGVREGLIPF